MKHQMKVQTALATPFLIFKQTLMTFLHRQPKLGMDILLRNSHHILTKLVQVQRNIS